jgi:hypothetical protein
VIDKEYGRQLKAFHLRTMPPNTCEGMEKYLGSGMLKGIGPIYAKKLIARFGTELCTLIIAVSIPLSILCSIIAPSATNNTLNVMTLGGLALAIGILVDDATVTVENIHRHMGRKHCVTPYSTAPRRSPSPPSSPR